MTLLSLTFGVINVHLTSLLRDWETVKNVFPGNSSLKPDQTDRDRKVAKQSKMLNNSLYITLGNNTRCLELATKVLQTEPLLRIYYMLVIISL